LLLIREDSLALLLGQLMGFEVEQGRIFKQVQEQAAFQLREIRRFPAQISFQQQLQSASDSKLCKARFVR